MADHSAFHPLAIQAVKGLEKNPEGEILLTPAGVEGLAQGLDELAGKTELGWAIESLVSLAFNLEQGGWKTASDAILKVARKCMDGLLQLGEHCKSAADNAQAAVAQGFQRFSGKNRAMPLAVGEARPKTSTGLGRISIPLRA